uniref:Uncharacterized protein n=1 Tax=Anopheles dirus TaxID=7168 RepID=A0A182NDP6_9DIPT
RTSRRVRRSNHEEDRAFELLRTSTQLIDGRYTTGLLWRYDGTILPNNRTLAIRRMECLERKLNRDAQLRGVMNNKVKEYLEKGYIRSLTTEEKRLNHPRAWYLPIFPVFNPNKPNKVRIKEDFLSTIGCPTQPRYSRPYKALPNKKRPYFGA